MGTNKSTPQDKKNVNGFCGKKSKLFIFLSIIIILLVCVLVVGGIILIKHFQKNNERDVRSEHENTVENKKDELKEDVDKWLIYERDERFRFRYPSSWTIDEIECEHEADYECPVIIATNRKYVWKIVVNPIFTGGVFIYMLPPGEIEEVKVKPNGMDTLVKSNYVTGEVFESLLNCSEEGCGAKLNLAENAWGGSVLFSKSNGAYTTGILLEGTKFEFEDFKWNHYLISYLYSSQKADKSDIPVKEEKSLEENLEIMNEITNSFEIIVSIESESWSSCQNVYSLWSRKVELDGLSSDCTVTSPFAIKGKIVGSWCFEASCLVQVVGSNGKVLGEKVFMLTNDWMTDILIDFETEIEFNSEDVDSGYLVFIKSNPSGLEENCGEVYVPVKF